MFKKILIFFSLIFINFLIKAQNSEELPVADYSNPQEYVVDTVIVSGVQFLDKNVLVSMSGYGKGSKINIPGDDVTKLVKKYWEHGLFEDVKVTATKLGDNKIALNIILKERPRLSRLVIEGINKSDKEDLTSKINLRPGSQVTENSINNAITIIKKFYIDKGYFNAHVDVTQKPDTVSQKNRIMVTLKIDKNKRVKIKDIIFAGNVNIPAKKLRKAMKDTKRRDWNIFNTSKYIESKYRDDKGKLVDYYNEKGYRDAKIISDSIQVINPKRIKLYISLYEGNKYYFRNIKWVGNTKYPTELLSVMLGIKKGDIFDQKILDKRLQSDEDAVSSIYLDNGYLFFNVTPVETAIENDSIDFEMRIYEGKQATLNNITITGNTKTNEHVVRRELRTLPGELFSRSDIIRTVRELANLGHFEPEKIEPNPIPNQANSTVDLEYKLVERANDQLELSGGWGGNMFVGTVRVKFSNFSTRNFFKLKEWRPVPSGDGQTLSIGLQTNGSYYRSYNISFMEPWFGGKKPNAFSFSAYHSKLTSANSSSLLSTFTSNNYMTMTGASVGLGKRLTWPDDFFVINNEIGYELYYFHNFTDARYGISQGSVNNISFATTLSRNSLDQLIYPRRGSNFALRVQFTPPYSLFSHKDFANPSMPPSDRYNWIEYHKWTFKAENYLSLIGNLVFMSRAQFGLLGMYNTAVGYPPFENFDLGGDGMNYQSYYNTEAIGLRGYENESLTPHVDAHNNLIKVSSIGQGKLAGNIYDKFTAELRYPITLKEQTAIYGLVFAEGGNAWNKLDAFSPFDIKRSLGVGLRVFLPMFGMLGVDWGYGFDQAQWPGANHGQFHFTLGQQF